jgi:hypothetical protein
MTTHAILIAIACLALASSAAHAQVPQREKMTSCNAEAKAGDLKGAERKAFMKSCLWAKKSGGATPDRARAKTSKP